MTCPSCGVTVPADGGHWCTNCGEYLWGRALATAHATGPDAQPLPFDSDPSPTIGDDPRPYRKPVAVTVPAAERFAEAPLEIEPGKKAKIGGTIRNQSEIVDQFLVGVTGFGQWWTTEPPDGVHLLPFGTGDAASSQGEFTLYLAPPRSSVAKAGIYEIWIVISSAATRQVVERIRLLVAVSEFEQIELDIEPQIRVKRRRAYFTCTVGNAGNHDATVALYGQDPEQACRIRVRPTRVTIPPGGLPCMASMEVMPVKPQLVGRQVDRPITLVVASGDDVELPAEPPSLFRQLFDASTKRASKQMRAQVKQAEKSATRAVAVPKTTRVELPSEGDSKSSEPESATAPAGAPPPLVAWEEKCTYTQRAWLPWWTALLLVALLVLLGLELHRLATRVPVPNVLAEGVSHARSQIDKVGLNDHEVPVTPFHKEGGPAACRPRTSNFRHTVGEVLKEAPAAGARVAKGTTVILCTYVLPGRLRVPNLYGLSPVAASQALTNAGFTVSDIEPYPPPQGEVVVRQRPAAFQLHFAARDKEVRIVLGELASVPNLVGLATDAATEKLRPLGLVLGQVQPKHAPADAVIRSQAPSASHTVQAGHEVGVVLGLRLPKVTGLGLAAATKALRKAGLERVETKPTAPPHADRVTSQTPRAGSLAAIGVEVKLTLSAPRQKKQKKSSAKPAASVPSVAGATAAAAAVQLRKAGVATRQVLVISAKVPAGKLISTTPGPGAKVKKGSTVTLTVSAGYPEIAVDNGSHILALNGATGKVVAHVAAGPVQATQPSWSPQGNQIAYIAGGRIMLAPATGSAGPRALTPAGSAFSLPTFPSSTMAPAVIATIERGNTLCFLAAAHPRPSCLATPYSLGNEISWSPSGTKLLVGGVTRRGSPSETGLLELTTSSPFATTAAAWRLRGFVTPRVGTTGARAAAFSPDGRQLAAAEDFGSPFSLALIAPTDFSFAKAKTFPAPTPVCSVAWRTDSQLVLAETSTSASCTTPLGALYVVDPSRPAALSLIATNVEYPSWQPLPGVR